jgi:hypothetical protein
MKKINLILCICIAIMAIVNLASSNTLSTKGIELSRLYQHTQDLGKINQQLEAEISQYTQLSHIQELATNQGFKRVDQVSLVSTSSLVASKIDTIYP